MLLTPQDPMLPVDSDRLQRTLQEVGFIGKPLAGEKGAFLVGTRFLSLMTFAGCSVHIELQPQANNGIFCHIRTIGPFEHPILLYGRNTRPPRCPVCRTRHKDWQTLLPATGETDHEILICGACGAENPPMAWDWKENAGFGKLFISVEEIFPGEATPSPTLSTILERQAGAPWRHFYVQDG